jgi:phosphate starvation-inducible PhoH-like protein
LRDPGPNRAAPASKKREVHIALEFDDNKLALSLFGRHSENLALIERRLGVSAEQRGNHVTIEGEREACEKARHVLDLLYAELKRGHEISSGDVEGAIRQVSRQAARQEAGPSGAQANFT